MLREPLFTLKKNHNTRRRLRFPKNISLFNIMNVESPYPNFAGLLEHYDNLQLTSEQYLDYYRDKKAVYLNRERSLLAKKIGWKAAKRFWIDYPFVPFPSTVDFIYSYHYRIIFLWYLKYFDIYAKYYLYVMYNFWISYLYLVINEKNKIIFTYRNNFINNFSYSFKYNDNFKFTFFSFLHRINFFNPFHYKIEYSFILSFMPELTSYLEYYYMDRYEKRVIDFVPLFGFEELLKNTHIINFNPVANNDMISLNLLDADLPKLVLP